MMKEILTPFVLATLAFAPIGVKADETVSQTVTVQKKKSITVQEMLTIAQTITKDVDGELNWSAIPKIMNLSSQLVDECADLPKDKRKAAITQVIDQVIDLTDTPFLPDKFTDPLFQAMVPAFVDVFYDNEALDNLDFTITDQMTTDRNYIEIANAVKAQFDDGFQWHDLLFAFKVGMKLANTLEHSDKNAKADVVKHLMNAIIDITDFPKLPDIIVDPICKMFVNALIDEIKDHL